MHWIRHTILTWVERNFGFAVAQAYAGHKDHGRGGRAMATYVRADLPEVATALADLTGEVHLLAINAPSHERTARDQFTSDMPRRAVIFPAAMLRSLRYHMGSCAVVVATVSLGAKEVSETSENPGIISSNFF
jgi:hypothetical protein